jgi:hypothetical protein
LAQDNEDEDERERRILEYVDRVKRKSEAVLGQDRPEIGVPYWLLDELPKIPFEGEINSTRRKYDAST